jgi:hypothetical protein
MFSRIIFKITKGSSHFQLNVETESEDLFSPPASGHPKCLSRYIACGHISLWLGLWITPKLQQLETKPIHGALPTASS